MRSFSHTTRHYIDVVDYIYTVQDTKDEQSKRKESRQLHLHETTPGTSDVLDKSVFPFNATLALFSVLSFTTATTLLLLCATRIIERKRPHRQKQC